MLVEGAREPVEEVLEPSRNLVVVFGREEPQAVGGEYGVANALHRLRGWPLDVLVHEGHIAPIEESDLGAIADNAFDLTCELMVKRLLAQRTDDHEDTGHASSFRMVGAFARPYSHGSRRASINTYRIGIHKTYAREAWVHHDGGAWPTGPYRPRAPHRFARFRHPVTLGGVRAEAPRRCAVDSLSVRSGA